MICTTIQHKNVEEILELLQHCEMAEIRLDRCELSHSDIEEVFSSDLPLVATCRLSDLMATVPALQDDKLTPQSREIKAVQIAESRLRKAIEAGARYVDVEIEAPKQMSKRIRSAAHENGTVFIRSYHNFEGTDSLDELRAMVVKCHYHGADMVKIATFANSDDDVKSVMSLYDWCAGMDGSDMSELANGGLIAFCMGEQGTRSRYDCIGCGAPFTYASSENSHHAVIAADEPAAPGQKPASEMSKAIYGEYKFIGDGSPALQVPCSKSFAQRAIIAAALADGVSHLRGYTSCGDNESALRVAEALGAKVERNDTELTITGGGAKIALEELNVGESGLLARMMIPLVAQLNEGPVKVIGERTLLTRPLSGAREILETFGCKVECVRDEEGLCNAETENQQAQPDQPDQQAQPTQQGQPALQVPVRVSGPMHTGRVEISGKHSSQLISGLLMALPFAEKNTTLVVKDPKSIPYMFITLEVLKKFGIKTGNEMLGGRDFLESDGDWSLCTEMIFKIKSGQKYKPADIDLEGDWSAAANFLVAGAVFGRAELEGLDTTSLQADLSIMDILMDAGASLSQLDGDKGNIIVQRAPLRAFMVDASNCPDLFPIVSVLAAFCQGTSRIGGLDRLSSKESDRAKSIMEMLSKMGVKNHREGNELVVEGHTLAQRLYTANQNLQTSDSSNLLKGGHYTTNHDHRMAMAIKVASLGAEMPLLVDDEDCVMKSFPGFNDLFDTFVCDSPG